MSKRVLVKFSGDYADEFDVTGFVIYDRDKLEEQLKVVEENWNLGHENGEREFYFGSNQAVICESWKEFRNYFTIFDITEKEEKVINKFFPGVWGYGMGSGFIEMAHEDIKYELEIKIDKEI